eukprot:COSAG06_NODE_41805_length_387_cov_1.256944_1_plen_51_part_10
MPTAVSEPPAQGTPYEAHERKGSPGGGCQGEYRWQTAQDEGSGARRGVNGA